MDAATTDRKEDGESIGEWLKHQRNKKNKKGRLDAEKEIQLEEIGVVRDTHSQHWDDAFTLLLQYKDREGDCNVPAKHKEDGKNLGVWLTNRRTGKKNGKLDAESKKN